MRYIAALVTLGVLSACAGLTRIQDPVAKFDQGVTTVAADETNFLKAVETVDCTSQFYASTSDWAMQAGKPLDISGTCTPAILSDQQLAARIQLMQALTLYADKMKALATGTDEKSLDTSSVKLAQNLNTVAKQAGFSDPAVAADVESAVIVLAEMLMDQRRFTDVKTAASTAAPALKTLVPVLKSENTVLAMAIASKLGLIEIDLTSLLVQSHGQRGADNFFDALEARQLLQSANPLNQASLASAPQPTADAAVTAGKLNAALDGIVTANDAIANAGAGDALAAADDLIARAKDAQGDQTTLAK